MVHPVQTDYQDQVEVVVIAAQVVVLDHPVQVEVVA
jgi:hypothetical protein